MGAARIEIYDGEYCGDHELVHIFEYSNAL